MIDCAVVLAVGSSIYQSQLVYNRPHPMLPILGKPMVVRTMERLHRAGIKHYIVVVGENEGAVGGYLNSHWLPNVQIEFVLHPNHSSLTKTLAGIARQLGKPFVAAAYNSFIHSNFPERLIKQQAETKSELILSGAPMSLSKSPAYAYAEVAEGQVQKIVREKPDSTNKILALANIAVLGESALEYLIWQSKQTGGLSRELMDILLPYVQTGRSATVAETAWILPIEADYDLLTVNKLFLDDDQDAHTLSELPSSVQIIPPVRIDPSVSVGQGAKIGPRVYLEAGCSIGHHAKISNAVIMQNVIVPAQTTINDAIVATRARISST